MALSRLEKDWKLLINRSEPTLATNKLLNLGWQFTRNYLIVQVSVVGQRDTWQVGGKIWATSLMRGLTTRFYTKELDLFAQELLMVPHIFNDKYSLYYRAPKHFTNVQLRIWEYIGENPIEDNILVNKIDSLITQNNQLEELLKDLIETHNNCPALNPSLTTEQKTTVAYFTNFL